MFISHINVLKYSYFINVIFFFQRIIYSNGILLTETRVSTTMMKRFNKFIVYYYTINNKNCSIDTHQYYIISLLCKMCHPKVEVYSFKNKK